MNELFYRPVTIETEEIADALPEGSLVLYRDGGLPRKYDDGSWRTLDEEVEVSSLLGRTAIFEVPFRDALAEFASWLEGGTPRAWGFEHPCGPGITWDPTIEEQKIMDAVDVIRDVIDYKESLR